MDAIDVNITTNSNTRRVLPSWASTSSSDRGSRGSRKRPHPSSKNPRGLNRNTDGNVKRIKVTINHGTNTDDHLLDKIAKRILPSYLQPSPSSSSRLSSPVKDVGSSSQMHEKYGNPYNSSRSEIDVVMRNNNRSRVLPPWMKSPTSSPAAAFGGQSDPYRPGVVQETHCDERQIYQVALQDLNQPVIEATVPKGLLSVPLYRHQKIALAWMLQKENSVACSGGILADDQGLGKTISVISLIQMQRFSSQPKLRDYRVSEAEALDLESDEPMLITGAGSKREFQNQKPLGGSLVVCPASVLRQWARELDEKVSDEAKLGVLIYHGPNRTKDPAELAQYDVVLTTYAIVAKEVPTRTADKDDDAEDDDREHKKRKVSNVSKKKKNGTKGITEYKGTLSKVHWFRVVLDEAQTIKNHSTRVSKSCCGLRAKKRWCLSGTPIQNSIDELFSYFRFLKCEPYSKYTSFCNQIKNPISRRSSSSQGYMKLQAVLKTIMIRRTKDTVIDGQPIITLPPKTIKLSSVDFSTEERDFYLKLEADSRSQFKAYAAAGTVRQNYANILLMLLRLRQACDHPLLVKGLNSESTSQVSTKMAKNLPREMQVNLLNILETLNICHLCSDPPEDAAVTLCGHVFCYQCVSEHLTGDDNTCPSPNCNSQIGGDTVFTKSTLLSCTSNDYDDHHNSSGVEDKSLVLHNDKSLVLHNVRSSSKIRATLEIIESNCRSNNPIKTIVFSQWTRMLDLVEMALNQHYIEYRRLDGSMSLASRDRAVKEFNTDPEVAVMLMSLKAGNLGLNMVSASHVILLDLWWNPATEDQAVDRAHRIGQTRSVTVSRLTIKDTVEDRILALQEEKRKMVASAFGEDQGGSSAPRLTAEDLKFLFMGSY
ncbi:Helicase, C-terminal [Artemisia annua]|uniref:Helicase, C-terminal n=1 Tax=Artemisia annua TaxID=35608 RepID=A0A2U1M897_ARTAN|nr:Helicase, C-terminal [Artemisia annua]